MWTQGIGGRVGRKTQHGRVEWQNPQPPAAQSQAPPPQAPQLQYQNLLPLVQKPVQVLSQPAQKPVSQLPPQEDPEKEALKAENKELKLKLNKMETMIGQLVNQVKLLRAEQSSNPFAKSNPFANLDPETFVSQQTRIMQKLDEVSLRFENLNFRQGEVNDRLGVFEKAFDAMKGSKNAFIKLYFNEKKLVEAKKLSQMEAIKRSSAAKYSELRSPRPPSTPQPNKKPRRHSIDTPTNERLHSLRPRS